MRPERGGLTQRPTFSETSRAGPFRYGRAMRCPPGALVGVDGDRDTRGAGDGGLAGGDGRSEEVVTWNRANLSRASRVGATGEVGVPGAGPATNRPAVQTDRRRPTRRRQPAGGQGDVERDQQRARRSRVRRPPGCRLRVVAAASCGQGQGLADRRRATHHGADHWPSGMASAQRRGQMVRVNLSDALRDQTEHRLNEGSATGPRAGGRCCGPADAMGSGGTRNPSGRGPLGPSEPHACGCRTVH